MAEQCETVYEHTEHQQMLFSIFDRHNPRSIINVVPTRLIPVLEEIKVRMPKTLLLPEYELRKKIKPSETHDRLRLSFWDEFNKVAGHNKKMSLDCIIRGACSYSVWVAQYERDCRKILWIVTPPKSYALAMRQILDHGIEKMLQVVQLPIRDEVTGVIDYLAIQQILSVVEIVHQQFSLCNITTNEK